MGGNPFDEGITIHDGPGGGYNWPLQQWRNYYTMNGPHGTNAIPDAEFQKEFPKVYEALLESDNKFDTFKQFIGKPEAAQVLVEVIQHLSEGKKIELHEMFPPSPVTPQSPANPMLQHPNMPTQQPAQPPPMQPKPAQGPSDNHQHQLVADAQGNGETDAATDGHKHKIEGGKVLPANNHTHETEPQSQPLAPQAQIPPQQPMSPMVQGR